MDTTEQLNNHSDNDFKVRRDGAARLGVRPQRRAGRAVSPQTTRLSEPEAHGLTGR